MSTTAFPIQRDLFSRSEVAEWLPPKPPRRKTPEDLLRLIRAMTVEGKRCFASVSWFASKLGVCGRTIQRWVKELSGRLEVLKNKDTRTSQYRAVENLSGTNVTPAAPHLCINSSSISSRKKLATARFEMPEPTSKNEFGRVERNPAWSAVQEVLRGASPRIQRAKNPVAYERAILFREFPQFVRRSA